MGFRIGVKNTKTALCLAIIVLFIASLWVGSTTTMTVQCLPDGTSTQQCNYPMWLVLASWVMFFVGLVGAVGLVFTPFRKSRRELPVFFQAHLFVPALLLLWIGAGLLFPFSPHQLTRVLPGFLLGANDWGVGNIYTYTKFVDWLALLTGCAACAHFKAPATSFWDGVAKRLRLCLPHLIAALLLHLVPGIFESGIHDALAVDETLLFIWLLVGCATVVGCQSLAEASHRRWPLVLSWLATFGWLFVPVAVNRP